MPVAFGLTESVFVGSKLRHWCPSSILESCHMHNTNGSPAISSHNLMLVQFQFLNVFVPFFMIKSLSRAFTIVIKDAYVIRIHSSIKKWMIWISQMQHRTYINISTLLEFILNPFIEILHRANFLEMLTNTIWDIFLALWSRFSLTSIFRCCLSIEMYVLYDLVYVSTPRCVTSETSAVMSDHKWINHPLLFLILATAWKESACTYAKKVKLSLLHSQSETKKCFI